MQPRLLVPGGLAIRGYGSGHGDGKARGAKDNLQQRPGYHNRRQQALVTYNTRTLRMVEKIIERYQELNRLQCDVIGLPEVRRMGEDTIILKSGNLLYFREGDQQSQ